MIAALVIVVILNTVVMLGLTASCQTIDRKMDIILTMIFPEEDENFNSVDNRIKILERPKTEEWFKAEEKDGDDNRS